jgi:6-pyruvoyltetrahydropterin/6-carboxytetrahydropterin synthase
MDTALILLPREAHIEVGRTYNFESAHYLPLVPEGHKCRNLHGHNYRVEIVMRGAMDERGFVKDFAEIDAEVTPLIRQLDHRLLNKVAGLENPTAEAYRCMVF